MLGSPHRTGMLAHARRTWTGRDWRQAAGLLGVLLALHVVALVVLLALVVPHRYTVGSQVFGVGLGVTAYVFGMRHAFDADHIAAIDNTTRKLMAGGQNPKSVGFWFAMGHSAMVFVLALLVAGGTHLAGTLTDESDAHQALRLVGTVSSGGFLYLIGLLNLGALLGIVRLFWRMRSSALGAEELERQLDRRGLVTRLLRPLDRLIRRPWHMVVAGVLFGVGFDTASEVTLLVMAGTSAAAGLPWYAVLVLPLLFTCGMSLLDALDGLFMNVAYAWAFSNPVRKVYYNLAVTALSVAVALLIGTVELLTVLHERFGWHGAVATWASGLSLNDVGFVIVGLFVLTWAVAVGYWRLARVEERWGVAL
ncbi:MAG: HoxN/HupN/NixA family nickel/cobalt transporter [Marmoricola sp.]